MFLFKDKYDKLFRQIKKDSNVAIWGTLGNARRILSEIKKRRKDIKIDCIIDSYNTGEFCGYDINTPEILKTKNLDYIIITSYKHAQTIEETIKKLLQVKTIKITNEFLEFIFTTNGAEKIFHTHKDKCLFEKIIKAKQQQINTNSEKLFEKIYQHRFKHESPLQYEYFDFINRDKIETVIDGGTYDGSRLPLFCEKFKNLRKIYTFDPLMHKFLKPEIRDEFTSNGLVDFFELGLWNNKQELQFWEDAAGSRIIDPKTENENKTIYKIKTTSIDEFVEENKITKVDFIKMDIEGAEQNALKGAYNTIIKHRPQMAICLYHKRSDYIDIPLYLNEILTNYIFRIGHYSKTHCGTCLYAIPKELLK